MACTYTYQTYDGSWSVCEETNYYLTGRPRLNRQLAEARFTSREEADEAHAEWRLANNIFPLYLHGFRAHVFAAREKFEGAR
jgi:hypothetical protein